VEKLQQRKTTRVHEKDGVRGGGSSEVMHLAPWGEISMQETVSGRWGGIGSGVNTTDI